jgi:hypothetical protein
MSTARLRFRDQIRDRERETHERGLHHPDDPPTEVRETEDHGAGHDRRGPRRVAIVTDLRESSDEEPTVDRLLPE